eukprot:INCI4779.2.p1 GENE.INCI4779.2~~INCI4779.2.p1  ORF type:complete len:483 (+),score=99.52 INCI4779.2:197-1645(+)
MSRQNTQHSHGNSQQHSKSTGGLVEGDGSNFAPPRGSPGTKKGSRKFGFGAEGKRDKTQQSRSGRSGRSSRPRGASEGAATIGKVDRNNNNNRSNRNNNNDDHRNASKAVASLGPDAGALEDIAPRQRSHGVPPNELAMSFHRLCRAGDEPARVQMLIKEGVAPLEGRDKSGRTPLYWALKGDSLANLKVLLEANADAATIDDEGHTLLHHAAQKRDDVALELLLRHGGWKVVNHTSNDMWEAPLHFAAMFGAGDCCELLLRHKADPGQFTLGGETAADLARQFRFPDVAIRLRVLAEKAVASKWQRADKAANFRLQQRAVQEQARVDAEVVERERKEREWREADRVRRAAEAEAKREAAALAEAEQRRLREERSAAGAQRARKRAEEEQQQKLRKMEEYEVAKEERYLRMLTKERAKRAEETARIHRDWRKADELMAAQEEKRKKEAQAMLESRVAQKKGTAQMKVGALNAFTNTTAAEKH